MPSLIKRSLQLNALEIYGVVVQRRRFIRAGTLTTGSSCAFNQFYCTINTDPGETINEFITSQPKYGAQIILTLH